MPHSKTRGSEGVVHPRPTAPRPTPTRTPPPAPAHLQVACECVLLLCLERFSTGVAPQTHHNREGEMIRKKATRERERATCYLQRQSPTPKKHSTPATPPPQRTCRLHMKASSFCASNGSAALVTSSLSMLSADRPITCRAFVNTCTQADTQWEKHFDPQWDTRCDTQWDRKGSQQPQGRVKE